MSEPLLIHWMMADSDMRHIWKEGTERRTLCNRTLRTSTGWTGRYQTKQEVVEYPNWLMCRTCVRRWMERYEDE